MSPWSSIGSIQNYLWAYGTFNANRAPILCQDYRYLQIDQYELLVEPRHLGVTSGVSKIISEAMAHSAQTMHPSYTDTNTVTKRRETRFQMTHIT
jgi:hypothetical protein